MTDDLIAFLRTALDRAQEDAEYSRNGSMYFDCGDQALADHYQRAGSPEAVLAQVAADRELLNEHPVHVYREGGPRCRTCKGPEVRDITEVPWTQRWPCRTLLLRAKAWGWKDEQHG